MLKNKSVCIYIIVVLLIALVMLPSCKKSEPEAGSTEVVSSVQNNEDVSAEPVIEETAAVIEEEAPVTEAAEDTSTWTAIELELPPVVTIGTPKDITIENLDPEDIVRPPILAPSNVTNVALNKPVTCSESFTFMDPALITDGNKQANDGYFIEFGTGQQYVTIDLEAEYKIYAVAVWHYHMERRVYKDVIVQVADDADFTENVRTIFNNDDDNSSGMGTGTDRSYIETNKGRLIDAGGVVARYVRLYSNENTSDPFNHYIEVEVYGAEAK